MKIDRPEKVVTEDNATVHDRAAAWVGVESAQDALNAAMRASLIGNQAEQLDDALAAYHRTASGTPEAATAWKEVRAQQRRLNRVAAVLPYMTGPCEALEAALARYIELGGSSSRAPGVGGLS